MVSVGARGGKSDVKRERPFSHKILENVPSVLGFLPVCPVETRYQAYRLDHRSLPHVARESDEGMQVVEEGKAEAGCVVQTVTCSFLPTGLPKPRQASGYLRHKTISDVSI